MHPYQERDVSRVRAIRRSQLLGVDGFTFAGSMLWELAGETTVPSKNDQDRERHRRQFSGRALFRLAGADSGGRIIASGASSPPS
jgi:hypothetical protein